MSDNYDERSISMTYINANKAIILFCVLAYLIVHHCLVNLIQPIKLNSLQTLHNNTIDLNVCHVAFRNRVYCSPFCFTNKSVYMTSPIHTRHASIALRFPISLLVGRNSDQIKTQGGLNIAMLRRSSLKCNNWLKKGSDEENLRMTYSIYYKFCWARWSIQVYETW